MAARPVIGITSTTIAAHRLGDLRRQAVHDAYIEGVETAGGLPLLLPNVSAEHAPAFLARVDGLCLTGGDDVDPAYFGEDPHPKLGLMDDVRRDELERALCEGLRTQGVPTLAICRGIQIMNVAYGGTLIQDIPAQVEGAIRHAQDAVRSDALGHAIAVEPGTRLHALVGADTTRVNSFHHQAVGRVAEGLVVSARSSDGVIEGLEDPAHPWCVGVQWHPERRLEDPLTLALFAGLVEAARSAAHAGA